MYFIEHFFSDEEGLPGVGSDDSVGFIKYDFNLDTFAGQMRQIRGGGFA